MQRIAKAQEYTIQGTFSYELTIYGQKEQPPVSLRTFELTRSKDAWRISVHVIGDAGFSEYVYTYDGTNLFYSSVPTHIKYTNSLSGIVVEPSSVPQKMNYGLGEYIWLAYVSGDYFRSLTNNLALSIEPLRSRTGYIRRREVLCKFDLNSAMPFLPMRVEYMTTNLMTLTDSGEAETYPLPSPYEKGFTSTSLISDDFTNVTDFSLPLKFQCKEYMMVPNAKSSADLFCTVKIQGAATNINTRGVIVVPELGNGKYAIQDLRVPEPAVIYGISNGKVPPRDSAIVEKARKIAQKKLIGTETLLHSKDTRHIQYVYISIFIVICAAPLAFLALGRGLRDKKKTLETK